jgi:DNA ligase-associated metallophosphoesterase
MTGYPFTLCGAALVALGSGALWWPGAGVLCVADLHLGKAERLARRGGALLPPYETRETLARLGADLAATDASRVICLGDSFDDGEAAQALCDEDAGALAALMARRDWTWIAGNHDPMLPGGVPEEAAVLGPLTFRHIAEPGQMGEVSGHYHPKAAVGGRSRPCFLIDAARVILPAYGCFTGGLRATDASLSALMAPNALAVLTGPRPMPMPMPRRVPA